MTEFAAATRAPPCGLTPDEIADAAAYHLTLHPALTCYVTLRMGFFFDGTGNNRDLDLPFHKESNVARLYGVFDALTHDAVSSVGSFNRFSNYVAGVGTPFKKEVGDTGVGLQGQAGMAAGWGGESRIVWALLQLQNNVHYFYRAETLSHALGYGGSELALLMRSCQDQNVTVPSMNHNAYDSSAPFVPPPASRSNLLAVSYDVANMHNFDSARRDLLRERATELRKRIAPLRRQQPTVEAIHLSVFGFSRGAAEARVFLNWLRDATDDGGSTLGGIPLRVIFVGLFDTVASVGFSEAVAEGAITGHGGWARVQDLAIPGFVEKCVHLVAAHEVRGSFPLDAAAGNVEEYVYPGVHSDVGGSYAPGDQGRSPNDADKLSQVPLGFMYRKAVAAGVPLDRNAPTILQRFKDAMNASPKVVSAFNAYIAAMQSSSHGGLVPIVHANYGKYVSWRRLRLDTLPGLPSTQSAQGQQRSDLLEANEELRAEAKRLIEDDRDHAENLAFYQSSPFNGASAPPHLMAFFRGLFQYGKLPDWEQVRACWEHPLDFQKDKALIDLFDNYVHDSRATFKPLSPDTKAWRQQQEQRMRRLQVRKRRYAQWREATYPEGRIVVRGALAQDAASTPPVVPLSQQEEADLAFFERTGELPMNPGGREFSLTWGYLRWRVIFQGAQAAAKLVAPRRSQQAQDQQFQQKMLDARGVGGVLGQMP